MDKTVTITLRMAALAAGLLLISCAEHAEMESGRDEPVGTTEQSDLVSFTASLEQPGSRTVLNGLDVCWNEGDEIRVFNASNPSGVVYRLTAGAGTTGGTFTGRDPGAGPYSAVYPASAATGLEGNSIRVSVPARQNYVKDSFGPGANLAVGKADKLEGLKFRNLSGVLSITLTGTGTIRSLQVTSATGEPLSGTALVDGLDTGSPALTFETGQACQVSLDCGTEGVALSGEGTTFFLTLPAGTLAGGFSVEIVDAAGNAMIKRGAADEANRMVRNEIRPMPALPYTAAFRASWLLSDEIGAFKDTKASANKEATLCCRYQEGKSQYAYLNRAGSDGTRYFRMEDWEDGYFLAFTLPYDFQPGKAYDVSVKAAGNSGGIGSSDSARMQVVKQEGDRIWLSDSATGNGFIILKVED